MFMLYTHTVPIHLEAEETFLLNLTGRQCLLLGTGVAISSAAFNAIPMLSLALLAGGLLLSAILILAFTRVAGRYLEEWAMIWLLFATQPSCFLWHAVPTDGDEALIDANETIEQEEEIW
jgi:hypothetical protein